MDVRTLSRRLHFGIDRRRAVSVALGIGALSLVAVPVGASATTAHKKLTTLQQGLNFYKGKVITIISPDNTGGGFDLSARTIAPFLAQYLHAQVNVTNVPAATTIAGQDLFEASPPDGLTVGMVNSGVDLEAQVTGSPGVNFNPEKTQFLGGNNPSGGGFTCLASSGYTSFAQVVQSTTPVSEAVISTGTQTLQLDLINASFGIPTKIIGGYSSTALEIAGFERGDGNCGPYSITTASFGSFLAAGKATQLLKLAPVNPATAFYQYQNNAMTLAAAEKQFPAKTKAETNARAALTQVGVVGVGHEWNLQPRVASYKVEAMRAAIKAALTNIQCEDKLLSLGQQNGYVTGPRALQAFKNEKVALLKVPGLLKSALGI